MLQDVKTYFANFDGATNTCRTIALWITIALVVAFVASKLYVVISAKVTNKYGKDELEKINRLFNGAWIAVALSMALAFIVTFAACYFIEVAEDEDVLVPMLFYPLLVFAVTAVGSGVAIFLKPAKIVKIVCAAVCGAAFIAAIVCIIVYYKSGAAVENNWGTDVLSNLGLYLSAAFVVIAVVAFAFVADKRKTPFDTRTVTFAAICVAMSFALSYVRIFKMPMGGSITFASMLPLMLFAFMFGSRKGILVGLIYGILQAVQDPWIIHPAQFVLDYAVAFASIGLTGCIRDFGAIKNMRGQFALGAVIACAFRFVSHYFAGVFAFGMYGAGYASDYGMPLLANEYFYSLVYQSMYIIPELIIVIAVGMILMSSKTFRKQLEIFSAKKPALGSASDGANGEAEEHSVSPV
ncbi:MAG: energy-coupled thiamine transporter ThiT [Clostridiales bacterium]|nr:energy-coupled thiamine transporter ThiT [Clostridiales bacterium]